MLKRIKVRSKLLFLVATPLIALVVFAATGVSERLDRSAFFTTEERIADLADAGADLTLAVNVERNRALRIEAGGAADLDGAVVATDAAVDRWLTAAGTARADLDGPVVQEIESFATLLSSALASRSGANMTVLADQLLDVGRGVDIVTLGLTSQAEDLDLYRALNDYIQLNRLQSGVAEITGIGADSIATDALGSGEFALLRAADVTYDGAMRQFRSFALPRFVAQLETLIADGLVPEADAYDPILELQTYSSRVDRPAATVEWLQQGEDRMIAIHQVTSSLLEEASGSAAFAATTASEQAQSFMLLAGAVIALALTLAVIVGRSISRPLRDLTANAQRLSSEELPALVDAMRRGATSTTHALTPIDTSGRDEIAKLSTAISDIQDVTVAVAEEQGELLRRGISDMFVNLARRNQSLLDRQIEFIDQLEADEENPDTLENLFRLDHLATRMRRNAESLLVLAGAESPRRRGQAVELVDVVRVAMGEIEDYSRIRLLSVEPATVAGAVAVDLAHLLSELMENASQFSPPETPVEVVGQRGEDGSYQLTIADQGIGLSTTQLIDANHVLANPPVVGLELGRSLGFTVVSRIASRLGLTARLTSSPGGGITAIVSIPTEMTGDLASTDPVGERPDALHATGLAASHVEPIGLPDGTAVGRGLDLGVGPGAESTVPSGGAVFDGDPLFDLGAETTAESAAPADPGSTYPDSPATATPGVKGPPDMFEVLGASPPKPGGGRDAGSDMFAFLDASSGGQAGSLPRRPRRDPESAPQTSLPSPRPGPGPGSAGQPTSAAALGAVDASVANAGLIRRTPREERKPETTEPPVSPSGSRSPEEVRRMLSRYRTGLRKGRDESPNQGDPQ